MLPAQTHPDTVLYAFQGGTDGDYPSGGLVRDSAGNLYGTAVGGASGYGVIYQVDATGKQTVLHNFTGPDGSNPIFGGLIRDAQGNLYGMTANGGVTKGICGVNGCGVVYKLDPTGALTVLHRFRGTDGMGGIGRLVRDSAGNLYGTTVAGGILTGPCAKPRGCGVVFQLDRKGRPARLYRFSGDAGGLHPNGVVRDPAGNLYGTAGGGGIANNGIVFELDTTWKSTVLYSFTGGADGSAPTVLTRDSAGNLYGAASFGGLTTGTCASLGGCGVVFQLDGAGKETVLYSFQGGSDGKIPLAGVIRDAAGNFYGTASRGGDATGECAKNPVGGCGVVFKLDSAGNETVLHEFRGPGGNFPVTGVIQDSAGNLYGATAYGGMIHGPCKSNGGCGVVFEIKR